MMSGKVPGIMGAALEELVRHHPVLKEDVFKAIKELMHSVLNFTAADLKSMEAKLRHEDTSVSADAMDGIAAASPPPPTTTTGKLADDFNNMTPPLMTIVNNICVVRA